MAGDGGGGELGIEIPKGDPEALRSAAGFWSGMGDALEREGNLLNSAANTVKSADWRGEASMAYSSSSLDVSLTMSSGAGSCRDAAGACREFATKLKDAQDDAKRALKQARAAKARIDEAKVQVGAAKKRLAGALTAQRSASTRLSTASAAGPAGAGQVAVAQGDLTSAQNAASGADGDIRLWTGRLTDAEADLERAQKEGKQANIRADQAARTAAGDFGQVAGAASPPLMVAGGAGPAATPVVPVTVPAAVAAREAGNPFGPKGGFAGDPFAPPGSPGNIFSITPGVIRQGQITEEAQRQQAAAEQAAKDRKGTIGDGLSGLVNGWTFGAVDLGGRKDTDRYRGGNAASYIPVTPMSVIRGGGRGAERMFAKKVEKDAAEKIPRGPDLRVVDSEARRVARADARAANREKFGQLAGNLPGLNKILGAGDALGAALKLGSYEEIRTVLRVYAESGLTAARARMIDFEAARELGRSVRNYDAEKAIELMRRAGGP